MTIPMPKPAPPYLPTAALVGVAWMRQRTRLNPGQVATSLPADQEGWKSSGFVTINALPSRSADIDLPQRRLSMLTADCWAIKGQWNLANQLAEIIRQATEAQLHGQQLTVAPDYLDARVQSLYLVTEPRVVRDDPSGFARLTFDVQCDWLVAP